MLLGSRFNLGINIKVVVKPLTIRQLDQQRLLRDVAIDPQLDELCDMSRIQALGHEVVVDHAATGFRDAKVISMEP